MYDLIIRNLDENGNPRPGWRRVRPHQVGLLREQLVGAGVKALQALPATSPRRAEVQAWAIRAGNEGILAPGSYPLGRGKAAMVIEAATSTSIEAAQARSLIAEAETRVLYPEPRPVAGSRNPAALREIVRVLREHGRR